MHQYPCSIARPAVLLPSWHTVSHGSLAPGPVQLRLTYSINLITHPATGPHAQAGPTLRHPPRGPPYIDPDSSSSAFATVTARGRSAGVPARHGPSTASSCFAFVAA